ncbi:MAG: bifunctional precorrin-2 dehydrogenase/sirohydrochlorin ferrochelatase [bacterium]|jgi:precorrin-2 dehydrogenase/sirohydrochlorin ferrochelatase
MSIYYPMMMNLSQRRCLVIGGGAVAERKVASLLEAGGLVILVSPNVTPRLAAMATTELIHHLPRRYRRGDLRGAFLCVVATNDRRLQKQIWKEAKEQGVLANIADSAEACDFLVPSYFRRGDLLVSISTAGKSPALAKRIRRDLEGRFGREFEVLLEVLTSLRPRILEEVKDPKRRRSILERTGDPDLLTLVRETDLESLPDRVWAYLMAV